MAGLVKLLQIQRIAVELVKTMSIKRLGPHLVLDDEDYPLRKYDQVSSPSHPRD
jgi:hypothetical protein